MSDPRLSPYGDTTAATRRRTIWVVVATGVVAAACLAWSLRIPAGDPWFYPATFMLAAVYIIGSSAALRMTGERLPWAVTPRGLRDAVLGGLGLAALFVAGGFMVRFLPPLAGPVHELLDHARVGGLAMVALTTAVNGVAEEAYYRGALWRVLPRGRRILVTTVAYTLVTSLAGIPLLALAAAALGALVGWLRERTRSLLPCVVAHLIWSLTMLFVLPSVV
ncbi:CPBP family intramembrane glutamic endopeptidase [Kocuria sp.]|uniref:CPBP family intramembrane glutamic endopeptidase n=1 Tax=Kocuria sp. TaxID=1871328 RepID=UPI00264A3978|nr:CPBP family intramembrane glutamic endopeptidase [Kocuria sp.]MDN5631101.1 CPBP family intramembrane metalloprotease [Kocuria sp.]